MQGNLDSGIGEIFANGIRNPGLCNPKYSSWKFSCFSSNEIRALRF